MEVSRSALVPYSTTEMHALVDDIESYPTFLPWCSAASIAYREGAEVEATLEMRRRGIRQSFTTRNVSHGNARIDLSLVDGPFRSLEGCWRFEALAERACKVFLDIRFEVAGRAVSGLLGPVFRESCDELVAAFCRRAGEVYE